MEEDRKPPKANGGVATATAPAATEAPAGRPDKDAGRPEKDIPPGGQSRRAAGRGEAPFS